MSNEYKIDVNKRENTGKKSVKDYSNIQVRIVPITYAC